MQSSGDKKEAVFQSVKYTGFVISRFFSVDMVLVWERPTVRTQEGVPQSNMVKPTFAQVAVTKKEPLDYLSLSLPLSLSLFSFLGQISENFQVFGRQRGPQLYTGQYLVVTSKINLFQSVFL